MDTKYVAVDGVCSPVFDSGPSDCPEAIVFVHGNPGSHHDFEGLFAAVRGLGRVVAADMPGFGRADRPASFAYDVQGYAEHLDGLLRSLGVRKAHLVLHDFGGPWGLTWAVEHPEAVASMTLINTGHMRGFKWHRFARIWQTPLVGELFLLASTRRLLGLVLNRDNPRPLPDAFIDRVWSHSDWGMRTAVLKLYRATRDPEAVADRLEADLRALDPPTCVIWGAEDKYIPVELAHAQRHVFPRAEVHVLEGLGHWPFVDAPDAVLRALLPFLRANVMPSG